MLNLKAETERIEARIDRIAGFYDALNTMGEWFFSKQRKEILRLARGNILEVGVGTGSSFKDYPTGRHILAVDLSREMLRRAGEKAGNYSGRIELRHEDVHQLSFKNESFDTVFTSLVFALSLIRSEVYRKSGAFSKETDDCLCWSTLGARTRPSDT